MNEEQRLRRIGELICKGMMSSRVLAVQLEEASVAVTEPGDRIVHYLQRHQAASPSELRAVLGLTRSTAYRALRRLLDAEKVIASGNTSAATYKLRDFDASRN